VVSEVYKALVHGGVQPRLCHYRESRGKEIDLALESGREILTAEIKSGATITRDFFKNLKQCHDDFKESHPLSSLRSHVIYGGDESQQRSLARVLSWRDVRNFLNQEHPPGR
jgi:hypothetical protein